MSIQIRREQCLGCKRCVEVCPGNLLKIDNVGKAYIRREQDCWGCTACLKECRAGAIDFFLGADVGGKGSFLSVVDRGDERIWTVTKPDGQVSHIVLNKREANKY